MMTFFYLFVRRCIYIERVRERPETAVVYSPSVLEISLNFVTVFRFSQTYMHAINVLFKTLELIKVLFDSHISNINGNGNIKHVCLSSIVIR
jgi:hypothetical protein